PIRSFMKVIAIIQARVGSTRLPGKVMLDLLGEPMLTRCIRRVQRAKSVDRVIVATTRLQADGQIESLCARNETVCFKGSEEDLLDRYYHAAVQEQADVIVRITSDCPLIDPAVVD